MVKDRARSRKRAMAKLREEKSSNSKRRRASHRARKESSRMQRLRVSRRRRRMRLPIRSLQPPSEKVKRVKRATDMLR
jgi:hypothetical protein